jgi:16S rRNA (guanine527-N7)-methyltransferase
MPLSFLEKKTIEIWAIEHGIAFGAEQVKKLGQYRDLIVSWSGRMNLVSRADIPHVLTHHILDSLGATSLIPSGSHAIDIGSGAGLPGIPLAIARADISMTLLESVHKKVVFLKEALRELSLANVTILEGRLETIRRTKAYDLATIRALPKLKTLIVKVQELVRPGGMIIYYEKRGVYRGIDV